MFPIFLHKLPVSLFLIVTTIIILSNRKIISINHMKNQTPHPRLNQTLLTALIINNKTIYPLHFGVTK